MSRKPAQKYKDFFSPQGMAVTKEGNLIVADNDSSCINIVDTTDWNRIRIFGQLGSGQVKFMSLHGIAWTHDGHIVIADWGNHCLQVLTVEGVFRL